MGQRRRRKRVAYTVEFLAFWSAYPRKVKKPLAAIAWLAEAPPLADVLAALEWQCRMNEWLKEDGQFIPHPATYINNRRWEDERPRPSLAPVASSGNLAAFQAFVAKGER